MTAKIKAEAARDRAKRSLREAFAALGNLAIWRAHLVIGGPMSDDFKHMTLIDLQVISLESDLTDVTITFSPRPEKTVDMTTVVKDPDDE